MNMHDADLEALEDFFKPREPLQPFFRAVLSPEGRYKAVSQIDSIDAFAFTAIIRRLETRALYVYQHNCSNVVTIQLRSDDLESFLRVPLSDFDIRITL